MEAVLERARRIELLILDVDGVLTDGRILIFSDGREGKFFHFHDGHGIRMVRQAGVTVALLTPPDPRAALVRFYQRAQPLGWWRPIAAEAGATRQRKMRISTGFGIALLGVVAVASGVVFLSSAYVARWGTALAGAVASVVAGLLFHGLHARYFARWEAAIEVHADPH